MCRIAPPADRGFARGQLSLALASWCARLGRLQRLRTVKWATRPPVLAHQLASAYQLSSGKGWDFRARPSVPSVSDPTLPTRRFKRPEIVPVAFPAGRTCNHRPSLPTVPRAVQGPPGNYRIPTGLAVVTTAFLRVFSQSGERLCKAAERG